MQFRHKNSLVRHLCQHTGERPHPCHICGQAFISTHRMKEHVKKYHPKTASKPPEASQKSRVSSCKEDLSRNGKKATSKKRNKKLKKLSNELSEREKKTLSSTDAALYKKKELSKQSDGFSVPLAKSPSICKMDTSKDNSVKTLQDAYDGTNSQNQESSSIESQIQPTTTALNVPVGSLFQANNGQIFLLTASSHQPTQVSNAILNISSPQVSLVSSLGYLTTAVNTSQTTPFDIQHPQYIMQQHSLSTQPPQIITSNVINQNNFNTMIINQPTVSSNVNTYLSSVSPKEECGTRLLVTQTLSTDSQKCLADGKHNLHQTEDRSCILTQDIQTKQSLLTGYGRQHQQNISKSYENQANTIMTNINTLSSEQHLVNQDGDVNESMSQQKQQQLTNSIQVTASSLESLKQLSTTSSSPPSSSLPPFHKQAQLSQEEIESQKQLQILLPLSTTFNSIDNITQQQTQSIQNDSYLCSTQGENERVPNEAGQIVHKNPKSDLTAPAMNKNRRNDESEEAIQSTTHSENKNKSRKKINCLRSVRRKADIEHIFSNNISMPEQLPLLHSQQHNKVMLSGVKEDKEISWSNYIRSMKEGDNEGKDIDLIKQIPSQLTNFNRSSSLSHPSSSSSVSFSNGCFRGCNITSTAMGNETLATINFSENEETLRILEKQESNNNMTSTIRHSVGDIIKVALAESKVC